MRKINTILLTATLLVFTAGLAMAQDSSTDSHDVIITVTEVLLVALNEDATPVALTIGPPTSGLAGDAADNQDTDASKALYYTVLSADTVDITVAITSGAIPSGLTLTVDADAPVDMGTDTTDPVLDGTTTSGTVISAIPNCYTGRTTGAPLTYTLDSDGTAGHQDPGVTITLTYTIASTP